MVVSPYFNHHPKKVNSEQLLVEDLINEQVYLAGYEIFYLCRESIDSIDHILGEDRTAIFRKAYRMAAFINNPDDWTEGTDFFSKFGIQINKQNQLALTRRHFQRYVPSQIRTEPRGGDLIFIPVFDKLFEIKKSSSEGMFFTLGKENPIYYTLELEMAHYSHESIDTDFEELNILETENTYVLELHLENGSVPLWKEEIVYQGTDQANSTARAMVKYWDGANNAVGVYSILGEFEQGGNLVGVSSGATWNISAYDDLEDHEDYRYYQNADLQVASNVTIDRTESNPFGSV